MEDKEKRPLATLPTIVILGALQSWYKLGVRWPWTETDVDVAWEELEARAVVEFNQRNAL